MNIDPPPRLDIHAVTYECRNGHRFTNVEQVDAEMTDVQCPDCERLGMRIDGQPASDAASLRFLLSMLDLDTLKKHHIVSASATERPSMREMLKNLRSIHAQVARATERLRGLAKREQPWIKALDMDAWRAGEEILIKPIELKGSEP